MSKIDLNHRQAEFVYEAARIAAISAKAPIVPEPWEDREEAFKKQFLKVISKQMGPSRSESAEALHESWMESYLAMGWVFGPTRDVELKTHPDLVSFRELNPLEKDKDFIFVALCEIARKWIK